MLYETNNVLLMKRSCYLVVLLLWSASAFPAQKLYENNFEKAEPEKIPEDLMVLDGGFLVKEEGGNKFLELPGAPLESFGVLFGPTVTNNISASAKIFGTAKGRRSPAFGVGVNGVGGLKLLVSPSKKMVELFKGDEVMASAPFTWESGSWTEVSLQLVKDKDGKIKAQGRVWKADGKAPDSPQIDYAVTADLPPGRSSIWGNPYSGTPIRYDDLAVTAN